MAKIGETPYSKYWIDGGILYFVYKQIDYLNCSTAKIIVESRLEFQQGDSYPIFCDTRFLKDSSKAARDYLANQGSLLAKAVAIYDNRIFGGSMIGFYMHRNRPMVPYQIFNDRDAALAFLATYQ